MQASTADRYDAQIHKQGLLTYRQAFGASPGVKQPTQTHFETHVFHTLSAFDPKRPVFVESESAYVNTAI